MDKQSKALEKAVTALLKGDASEHSYFGVKLDSKIGAASVMMTETTGAMVIVVHTPRQLAHSMGDMTLSLQLALNDAMRMVIESE
jgi:hypothetical protein